MPKVVGVAPATPKKRRHSSTPEPSAPGAAATAAVPAAAAEGSLLEGGGAVVGLGPPAAPWGAPREGGREVREGWARRTR
jgi:hypothetical protein